MVLLAGRVNQRPLLLASGSDAHGLAYALLELADRATYADQPLEALDFRWFSLQPMDGPEREANTRAAVRYCLEHPRWRLSLQTHKYLGIP